MNKLLIKAAILGVLLISGGCTSFRLPGEYSFTPTAAKNPAVLSLEEDGRYTHGSMYADQEKKEKGRWWKIRGDIVILVPDDSSRPLWFARVPIGRRSFDDLKGYHTASDVRLLLDEAETEKK